MYKQYSKNSIIRTRIIGKEHAYKLYKLQLFMLSPRGLEVRDSMGKAMVVASMYPASRIVANQLSVNIPVYKIIYYF